MSVLVIQPGAAAGLDTQIATGSLAELNFGAASPISIGTRNISKAAVLHRLLIRFDVSGLPAGSSITSAELLIHHNGGVFVGTATFYCRRVTQGGWLEDQATWNAYATGQNWTAGGGDFTTTLQDSVAQSSPAELVFTSLKPLVEDAIANRSGLLHLLVTGPETGGSDNYLLCTTSDDANSGNWPKLSINYQPPAIPIGTGMTGSMQELVGNLRG